MFIKSFSEISLKDTPTVGGKGSNLGEMTQVGLPIPPGFCITAKAYQYFINSTEINNLIEQLQNLSPNDLANVSVISKQLTELFIKREIPQDLKAAINDAFIP